MVTAHAVKSLETLLLKSSLRVPAAFASRQAYVSEVIQSYYLPIFTWAEKQQQKQSGCLILGLSCVQGGGKTTMATYMEHLFQETGKKCATLSLDDVYVPHVKQLEIASTYPSNPLLQHRGNPGTHDLGLLLELIHDAKAGKDVVVPRYDKSAFNGRGDRCPQDKWIAHQGPLDVLLIEGWCLGFEAVADDVEIDQALRPVNNALREFDSLYAEISAWIVVQVGDVDWVYTWREQAEERMRQDGKPALTPDQVRDFVDRFMPAYRLYLPHLYTVDGVAGGEARATSKLSGVPRLTVEIGRHRECLAIRSQSA